MNTENPIKKDLQKWFFCRYCGNQTPQYEEICPECKSTKCIFSIEHTKRKLELADIDSDFLLKADEPEGISYEGRHDIVVAWKQNDHRVQPDEELKKTGFNPKVLGFQDFLSEGNDEQAWVVADMIPKPGFAILAGAPGACKSFSALEIATEVAKGGNCFGHFSTAEKAAVLYIDEENNPNEICKRIRKFGLAGETLDLIFMNYQGFSFDRRECTDWLTDFLEQRPDIKLIIVDSLRRVSRYEENKSGEVSELLNRMKGYSEQFGVSWLILHHLRKSMPGIKNTEYKDELRGSGDLMGFADVVMVLQKHRKGGETTLTLFQTKNRYAPEMLPQEFKLIEDKDAGTLRIDWEGEVQEKETLSRVIADEILNWVLSESIAVIERKEAQKVMQEKNYSERNIDDALKFLDGQGLATRRIKPGTEKPIPGKFYPAIEKIRVWLNVLQKDKPKSGQGTLEV